MFRCRATSCFVISSNLHLLTFGNERAILLSCFQISLILQSQTFENLYLPRGGGKAGEVMELVSTLYVTISNL